MQLQYSLVLDYFFPKWSGLASNKLIAHFIKWEIHFD